MDKTKYESIEKLGTFLKTAGLPMHSDLEELLKHTKELESKTASLATKLIQAEKDLDDAATRTQAPKEPPKGPVVKFGKAKYNQLGIDPNVEPERYNLIPHDEYDPCYNVGAWRAVMKAGSLTYRATAEELCRNIVNGERVFLSGEPSVGKSSVITQFAIAAGWPMIRFQCKKETSVYDFIGHMSINKDGSTQWMPGALYIAMTHGAIFNMDEQDHLNPECTSYIHGLLEAGGNSLWLPMLGKKLKAHKDFRIVATGNTIGHGDQTGRFVSANVQDAATLSRWACVYTVERMTPKNEANVIREKTGIDRELADKLAKLGADTYKEHKAKPFEYRSYVTLRDLLAAARSYMALDKADRTPEALGRCIGFSCITKQDPTALVPISDLFTKILGDKVATSLDADDTVAEAASKF